MSNGDRSVSKAELARELGCVASYVTKLAAAGRLVMANDGERVLLQASLARIAETADAARSRRRSGARGGAYYEAQTRLAEAQAALREFELRERAGELIRVDDVRRAVADAGIAARQAFEALPDRLASQLAAERDAGKCAALLADEVRRAVDGYCANLARLAGGGKRGES